ncbi:MAG: hypothetical protein H8D62_00065 [Bacteroidetes bacterium]|nr:hypothetical protein [Bacteroidota bacterium]
MKTLSISQIIDKSWELFKAQAGILIGIIVVYCLISGTLSFIQEKYFSESFDFSSILFIILSYAVSLALYLGLIRVAINVADGKKVDLDLLFSQRNGTLLLHYFAGNIVFVLFFLIGLIFFIVPGFYIMFRLQFFQYALLEQEQPDFWRAINESWEMTEGKVWDLAGLAICSLLILLLGLLALFIGLLAAIPVVMIIYGVTYRVLNS